MTKVGRTTVMAVSSGLATARRFGSRSAKITKRSVASTKEMTKSTP